jgi:hypothetical protein
MMFNKYDDMKSLTIKNNGKGQNNFFCQSCGTMLNGKGSVTLVKNGTTIAEEIIQKQDKVVAEKRTYTSQSRTKTTKK